MIWNDKVRKPSVAGQFYEADPQRLKAHIAHLLSNAGDPEPLPGRVRAVILPHAGYVFSGETAVKTALSAQDGGYKRALVLAPSHRIALRGLALADYESYATPLGEMPLDTQAIETILASGSPNIQSLNQAHAHEHALEVELPILQTLIPGLKLIPIICGHVNPDTAISLAETLKAYWEPETLWVISSDFTHYGASFGYMPFRDNVKENLRKLDLGAVARIEELDLNGFADYINDTEATICGANPIMVLLAMISRGGGGIKAKLIDYITSGDKTGDWNHCVSYAGMAFHQG